MTTLIPYREWAPTPFDRKNLNGDSLGISDFYVAALLGDDADPLDASNYHTILARLGGESPNVQIHHFGHWGYDFDLILVAPIPSLIAILQGIAKDLENYPVLDEDDYVGREYTYYTDLGYVMDDSGEWIIPEDPEEESPT